MHNFNKTKLPSGLKAIAVKYGINYVTLWTWVRMGRIILPRDENILGQLVKGENGRYYLPE